MSDFKIRINEIASILDLKVDQCPNISAITKSKINNISITDNQCTLIRGDNYSILNEMCLTLNNCIDFCYIDPPYNTKNSFVYSDTRVSNFINKFGTHAAWMSFMLPRLALIHPLLSEKGLIAVSIDDYEQPYLRVLLDNIFGENNFIANLVICRSKNGRGSKKNISINHEYVLIYGKSNFSKIVGSRDKVTNYDKSDKYGSFRIDGLFRKKGDASRKEDRPNMYYPLYYDSEGNVFTENSNGNLKESFPIDSKGIERRWLWGQEKARNECWKLYASPRGVIYVKNYNSSTKRVNIKSIWDNNEYLTERGTNQIKQIYGEKIFETPKPIELLEDLIDSHTDEHSIIIDFFAGTGTTAHAAYNLNKKSGGSRKVILVENDQIINPKHLASKHGYSTISEITEKRLQYLAKNDHSYNYLVI